MIGRNDVTGTRDVKITQFPRSPWRTAVASSKSERRQTPARVGSFLFLSFFLFLVFKKFQFLFLASLRFLFVSATLTYSWQPTSVAYRSEVAPLLESSKPQGGCSSISTMADAGEREEKEKKKRKCMFREREREREREIERKKERERERERNEANKSRVLLSISCGASCFFSHQSTSRNPRSRMKTKLRLPYLLSDSTSHVRLSFLVNWQDMITVCMTVCLDGNGNSWTRSPMLRLDSNFPQRVDNRLASNRKDQVTERLFEQLLLRFKRKVGWRRHGQAQKFEVQEAQWKIKEFAGGQLKKARGVRTRSRMPIGHPIRQIFLGSIPNIEDRIYRLHTRAMGLWGYEILSFLAKNRQ